jgi:hypothetical protein
MACIRWLAVALVLLSWTGKTHASQHAWVKAAADSRAMLAGLRLGLTWPPLLTQRRADMSLSSAHVSAPAGKDSLKAGRETLIRNIQEYGAGAYSSVSIDFQGGERDTPTSPETEPHPSLCAPGALARVAQTWT